ncbi:hypothetical protein HY638_05470 [Candidatus Woesearchaeota archaeon]|nr:hypothetical protein [Candidatus Woesearchaeota archaeon]
MNGAINQAAASYGIPDGLQAILYAEMTSEGGSMHAASNIGKLADDEISSAVEAAKRDAPGTLEDASSEVEVKAAEPEDKADRAYFYPEPTTIQRAPIPSVYFQVIPPDYHSGYKPQEGAVKAPRYRTAEMKRNFYGTIVYRPQSITILKILTFTGHVAWWLSKNCGIRVKKR